MNTCILRIAKPLNNSIKILSSQLCKITRPRFTNFSRSFSNSYSLYSDRKFTDKHEWVDFDGSIGTVGITNYAQEALGDLVYAQLPEVGTEYSQMDECGALESVKAASELYAPVSGKITEINSTLEGMPSVINESCYDKGWLFRLELSKVEELDGLMDEKSYEKFVTEQPE